MNNNPIFGTQSATEVFSNICANEKIGTTRDSINREKCQNVYRRMKTVYPGMSPDTFILLFETVLGYSRFMCEVIEIWITDPKRQK